MPSTPSAVDTGASAGSNGSRPRPSESGELAPAEVVRDPRSLGEPVVAGRHDLPDGAAGHRLADAERGRVRLDGVHPAAHVRVDRDEGIPDQHLPLAGIGHVRLDEREVLRPRDAVGARGEVDLPADRHPPDPTCATPRDRSHGQNVTVESLRGQLLVAGPDLLDPNFRRSVLLVGEHGEEGAMGVILNRPSPVSVHDAVPPLAELVDGEELVHVGGPVQPQAIVVLGDFSEPDEAAALVLGSIGFLPAEIESADDVRSLSRARVFAGYAGWAAGQLESEIEEESWIIEPALPEDVFTQEPEQLWSTGARAQGRAVRRAGADAARPEPELEPHVAYNELRGRW